MSDDANKNRPLGSRPEDGFGLPPMTGVGGGLPGIPGGGGLPPSERVGAGMGSGPVGGAGGGAGGDEVRIKRPVDAEKEAMIEAVVSAPVAASKTEAKETKKEPEKKPEESLAGVIDTFEAIVIALILALTFRAFVVEAFVIPTGSMAPTLLGAHFNVTCPKCGYSFAENADLNRQINKAGQTQKFDSGSGIHAELTDSTNVPAATYRRCPNCLYDIHAKELPDHGRDPKDKNYFPWTNNGDRILVLKYLYTVMEPDRFDVIVFKEPRDGRDNYIKRLVGLPGETVEIIDGDIFAGNATKRVLKAKPRNIQDAVWQLVYDNDYYPIDAKEERRKGWRDSAPDMPEMMEPWTNPWVGAEESSWTVERAIKYGGDKPGTLAFSPKPNEAYYGLNVLGYNSVNDRQLGQRVPVGDLRLEAEWLPEQDGAEVSLTVGKAKNRWQATLKADGSVVLRKWDALTGKFEDKTPTVHERTSATRAGAPRRLTFSNVDRVVEFFVDGKLLARFATEWTADEARVARDERERPEVSLTTSGPCTIAHLKLMRDLYYTQGADTPQMHNTANLGNPVSLGADEFFALGDNSTNSLDGRLWDRVHPALDDLGTRLGVVPRRYLLGKAFFVYWPAGYRASENLPLLQKVPLIPNAGEMRLIR